MKKKDWKWRSTTERRYSATLQKVAAKIAQKAAAAETLPEMVAIFRNIQQAPWFKAFAELAALKMVQSVQAENAKTWREAARQSGQSHEIYKYLRNEMSNSRRFTELVQRNAGYIKSMPMNIARQTTEEAATKAIEGLRGEELEAFVREKVPDIADWKARLIARTETGKTQAAVTQIRSEELDIDWYVWRTSEDQRVRSSHDIMEGVLCRYSDPPSPELLDKQKSQGHYGPGEIYNCRCYAEPLIKIDYLTWPRKVYHNGRIQTMTKPQFMRIAGVSAA